MTTYGGGEPPDEQLYADMGRFVEEVTRAGVLLATGGLDGLLRQYFPKSSDLAVHSAQDLDWVAAELNDRPRKRLGFKKPIEQIGPLLLR